MGILAWIVTGFIAGLLAQWVTGHDRRGCLYTIVVGILGGLIGGALFSAAGEDGVNDFGLWSILVAFLGACLLLLILQAVAGRRLSRRR
jgi:uncharacterized membrane protein YeaQ/YmgE (transglycosylase-associated protein family)